MADENDPNRPEDEPPKPSPGEPESAPPELPMEVSAEPRSDAGEASVNLDDIAETGTGEGAPPHQEPDESTTTHRDDLAETGAGEGAPLHQEPDESATAHRDGLNETGAGESAAFSPSEFHQPSSDLQTESAEPRIDGDPVDPSASLSPDAAPSSSDLPPNYFRAAGDPDEGEAEAPPSQLGRLKARVEQTARDTWAAVEPQWVKVSGAARGGARAAWHRVREVKGPRSVREAAVWSGLAAGSAVALIVGFFFFVTWGMPSTDDLWEARGGQSITFLDRNGNVILREGAQNAPPVDLATLPPYLTQAFIAIEDRRFYNHFGLDVGGMMRAAAENMRSGRVVQGGSTITQQLAKNLFLNNERSWRRKTQEMAMAIWLETRFTKDEILALYLSRVYFGAGAYGIEAAAERYFDRPARELTLLQAAMLAGLVKAPSRLNPARQDITAARDRAVIVLNEMVALGFISEAERQAALGEDLVVSRRNPAGVLSYYRDWIDALLDDVIGQQRDAFIVETTLDITSQRAAAQVIEDVLAEQGQERRVEQAALLALDDEGGVRAMVGGRDYDQSQFNRVTQARRQPGSAFKYFIYLAAMENGLTPWSVREDAPITVHIPGQPSWTPGNYTREFHGRTELTRAFAQSFNMVAIRVANEVGGQTVIDTARRLGVRSPLYNYHSLALGAQELTLLEMTQAYGAMAAEGYNVEAHGVARIRRANNNETMWSWRPQRRERVIEERALRYMNHMMARVVQAGTGTRARMETHQIGGKTGTGNDYRDAWFVGYTPGYVAGVWVGNDNFTPTARVTGGSLPADIWARYMQVALQNVRPREMQMPLPEDYDLGAPLLEVPAITAIGAPIGALDTPALAPRDNQDRSLDFGPEG